MKKIIQLSALIVLLPVMGLAQGQSINKLFNKYEKVIGFELLLSGKKVRQSKNHLT